MARELVRAGTTEQAAPAHVEAVRTLVFDGFSPAEVAQLERFATTVLAHLDAAC